MIAVIIVEDDPMVRDINSRFLLHVSGFTLQAAVSNVEEAKTQIRLKKPNLILLDVYLPKESGVELLKWIRSEALDIDVILVTADKSIDRVLEGFRYGVVDYLIKPFTFERFKEALINFQSRHTNFAKSQFIEQNDLDKLLANSSVADCDEEFSKGINKYTYIAIWQEICKKNSNDFTAETLATELGIARVTVRRYLEHMKKENKLTKIVEYGRVGRPQNKYRKQVKA